jgi:phosphohistidine swiveling domain-containing protein
MAKFTGVCVCPGTATGSISWKWQTLAPDKATIAALTDWTIEGVLRCIGAGAIVCMKGGIISHASIIARELGVPALVAVKNLEQIPDGTIVRLDASDEEIILI